MNVQLYRHSKCVVELGVCDQPTWIVGQIIHRTLLKRIACAERTFWPVFPLQLFRVQRLDISTVILVEIGQAIVQKDGRIEGVGDRKSKRTNVGADVVSIVIDLGIISLPLRRLARRTLIARCGGFE